MTPGKVFHRFVLLLLLLALLLLHNNHHHLVFFFFIIIIIIIIFLCCFFLLLVICLTSMSFGLLDIAEIWKAQRDSRHSSSSPSSSVLALVLLHSKCCRGDCLSHVTVKVLLRRIFFSLVGYLQSVLLLWRMNFFLSCGLPTFQ
jgi:hypothetical protein